MTCGPAMLLPQMLKGFVLRSEGARVADAMLKSQWAVYKKGPRSWNSKNPIIWSARMTLITETGDKVGDRLGRSKGRSRTLTSCGGPTWG